MKSKEFDDVPPSAPINRLAIWLAVLGLGICFMPVMLISTTLRTHQEALLTQMNELQQTLTAPPMISDETNALSQSLVESQSAFKQLTTLQSTLEADHMDWVALIGPISRYDPSTLALTNLNRSQRQITISGHGRQETDVMDYINTLRSSDQFEQVTLQSLIREATTPTPAASPTPSVISTPPYQVSFVLALTVKALP